MIACKLLNASCPTPAAHPESCSLAGLHPDLSSPPLSGGTEGTLGPLQRGPSWLFLPSWLHNGGTSFPLTSRQQIHLLSSYCSTVLDAIQHIWLSLMCLWIAQLFSCFHRAGCTSCKSLWMKASAKWTECRGSQLIHWFNIFKKKSD